MGATATAVTATRRQTWSGHEARMRRVPRPQDTPRTPRRGVEWLNRYGMRFLEGAIPQHWDGGTRDDSLSRLRAKLESDLKFRSMTVYYHADARQLAATAAGHLLLQAQGQGFGGGYFDHGGQLWDEGGTLLATTHQVVYYKE
jgi:acyl-CoA thioesterase